MPEQARLRVHGQGKVEVELAAAFLGDLKHAYDSVLLFETTIDGMRRTARDFPFPRYPFALDFEVAEASVVAAIGLQQLRKSHPLFHAQNSLSSLPLVSHRRAFGSFWEHSIHSRSCVNI
jgi:hypothetical protein